MSTNTKPHLQRMPAGFDRREMLKLSVGMKDGPFEVEAGQGVDADLSVLIRRQQALAVESTEGRHVDARVVGQHVQRARLNARGEGRGEGKELFVFLY